MARVKDTGWDGHFSPRWSDNEEKARSGLQSAMSTLPIREQDCFCGSFKRSHRTDKATNQNPILFMQVAQLRVKLKLHTHPVSSVKVRPLTGKEGDTDTSNGGTRLGSDQSGNLHSFTIGTVIM